MPTCFRLSAFQMITVLCIILKQKESMAGLPKWVHRTESCPMPNNLTAWMKASERLNCLDSLIANSIKELQHVYHCMPSAFLNESLEFCSPVTRILNASCAVYNYFDNDRPPNNTPNSKSCSAFRKGCPLTEYFSNDIYKYKECFNFNSKHGCYYGDPNCEEHIQTTMDYTKEVYFTSELQTDISTSENDITKRDAETFLILYVVIGVLGGVCFCVIIPCSVLLVFFFRWRKKKENRYKGEARPAIDVLEELKRKEEKEKEEKDAKDKALSSTCELKDPEGKDQAEDKDKALSSTCELKDPEGKDQAEDKETTTILIDNISPISRLLSEIAKEIPDEKIPMLKCNLKSNIGENDEEWRKISELDRYDLFLYMNRLYDFNINMYILMGYLEAIQEKRQLKKCMKFVKNADKHMTYYMRKRTVYKYSKVYLKIAMKFEEFRYEHIFNITNNMQNLLSCKIGDIMIYGISEGCILLHLHVKSTLLETLRKCDFSSMQKYRVYKISISEECIFYRPDLDDNFHKNEESRNYMHRLINKFSLKNTCQMIRDICWKGTQSKSCQKMSKEARQTEDICEPLMEMSNEKISKESLPEFGAVQQQNSVCVTHKDEWNLMSMENKDVPEKVLNLDYDAPSRYVEWLKKGSHEVYKTPGMIVGCTRAGKTTLLKRLQERSIQELRQTQSTTGVEVFKNIFQINRDNKSLIVDVPEEIQNWDYDSRSRYVEWAKKGTQSIHRARARIVGCARGGKTTLLKLPLLKELRQTQLTIGLEVFENISEIKRDNKSLIVDLPEEVQNWDYDSRSRYVELAKKETKSIHRARAMIVGCAKAGKTTLLKRLQERSIQELWQTQSTIGLEVFENIFEINRDNKSLIGLGEHEDIENKSLLTVVDFAGQCAYYACHQVYPSKRAFYLLVIDMSKRFDEKLDEKLCEQEETIFGDWTFGQYILFWLRSIHTHCDDKTTIVTIATHCDKLQDKVNLSIYDDLLELLQYEPDMKKHLDRRRCFHIGFPKDDDEHLDKLADVVECIASIALEDRWRETIAKDWACCERILRYNQQNGKKCISFIDFNKQVSIQMSGREKETYDVLKFYHDNGAILFYNEDLLSDTIIIDVQWFVDCFKNIITDPKHTRHLVENDKDWQYFYKSGYLSKHLLKVIWKKKNMNARKRDTMLNYMQRLGLLAVGEDAHYVPCMNKLDFDDNIKEYFTKLKQKTSVLVLKFHFLPYFFYCRLIVACIVGMKWNIVVENGKKYLFKHIAFFWYKGHIIGIAVTRSTIQVQVFKQGKSQLDENITMYIKQTMEDVLENLTKNFHKKTLYDIGYLCSRQDIFEENTQCFILEQTLVGKGIFSCPNHGLKHHYVIKEKSLLRFWKYENHEEITGANNSQEVQEQRKEDFSELKTLFSQSWQYSVGHLLCCKSSGTAFRVGDRYLLTAFHIIEKTMDVCMKMIIEHLQSDPNRGKYFQCFLQKLKVNETGSGVEMMIENGINEWITKCKEKFWISNLLEAMKVSGFTYARENILKYIDENPMQVVFGCVKELEDGLRYPVKFDIPFYSKTEDIAILEIDWTNLLCLPMAFTLERSIIAPESIHILGYLAAHGRKQFFDQRCPLIFEKEARSTLEQWKVMYPEGNFENFIRACDSAFSGKEKVLFRYSETTAQGASGSPGLILSDTDKPKVYLMLQEGFPLFVYGNHCPVDIKTVPKEYLIVSGISMSRVYSLLSTTPYLVNLRNAIFHF